MRCPNLIHLFHNMVWCIEMDMLRPTDPIVGEIRQLEPRLCENDENSVLRSVR